jgi:hypothetical protein
MDIANLIGFNGMEYTVLFYFYLDMAEDENHDIDTIFYNNL